MNKFDYIQDQLIVKITYEYDFKLSNIDNPYKVISLDKRSILKNSFDSGRASIFFYMKNLIIDERKYFLGETTSE